MLKSLLLTISASAMALGATAQQSHHGFYWQPEQWDLDAFVDNDQASSEKWFNCWFTPEVIMPMLKSDGTLETSNIYANNVTTMLVRPSTMDKYFDKITGTSLSATATLDDNTHLVTVTLPSQMDYPRTEAHTPNWVDVTSDNCAMLFHCVLGSKPYRINDAENTLSATGERSHLDDCTGVYVGIQAPVGATVKAFLSTSEIKDGTLKKDVGGTPYNPNLAGKTQTAAFDFDFVGDGKYHEITSGEAYGALAGMKYVSASWPDGYCTKYVDVVVYGVKPGDVVGFSGIQTLHPDWTPQEFIAGGAGVEAIGVDNANAPVEYFNIQGMRIDADNLTPGLYIKRQGTETTKLIVK